MNLLNKIEFTAGMAFFVCIVAWFYFNYFTPERYITLREIPILTDTVPPLPIIKLEDLKLKQ